MSLWKDKFNKIQRQIAAKKFSSDLKLDDWSSIVEEVRPEPADDYFNFNIVTSFVSSVLLLAQSIIIIKASNEGVDVITDAIKTASIFGILFSIAVLVVAALRVLKIKTIDMLDKIHDIIAYPVIVLNTYIGCKVITAFKVDDKPHTVKKISTKVSISITVTLSMITLVVMVVWEAFHWKKLIGKK